MAEGRTHADVDRETLRVARASYDRCCARPDFFRSFYRVFFERCPEAEPRFAHTDFERQTKLLQHAIGLLLIYPAQPEDEPNLLARVAERHSRRELDIPPALYGPFVDSLVATVRDHDPAFGPEVERAWRAALAPGVAYMQSRYEDGAGR